MSRLVAACALVVALGACGGSAATVDDTERDAAGRIIAAGRLGTQALRAGDCFVEPEERAVLTVTGIPCSQSHDGQVIARAVTPDADGWPGRDALGADAGRRCGDAAAGVLTAAALGPSTGLSAYVPDERSWDSGDRDIVCFVEATGATRLEGDLFGSAA